MKLRRKETQRGKERCEGRKAERRQRGEVGMREGDIARHTEKEER